MAHRRKGLSIFTSMLLRVEWPRPPAGGILEGRNAMRRLSLLAVALLASVLAVAGCSMMPGGDSGWTTLIDGTAKSLDNWNRIGDANWRVEDGAVVADKGKGGYLVAKNSYKDFQIRAEFWADTTTNSGIFLRAADPKKIGADTAYEVNVYDMRPDPSYGLSLIHISEPTRLLSI